MIILSQRFKPWCWRCILRSGEGSSPALFLDVKPQEVVQHALAIVPAKHVDGVLVGNHRVLGAASPHKLITCRHFSPAMNCLKWPKVKSKTFSCLWPIRIELCVKWSWICHDHFRKSHFFSLITSPVGHSWGVSQSSPEITKVWSRWTVVMTEKYRMLCNGLWPMGYGYGSPHGRATCAGSSSASAEEHRGHHLPDTRPAENNHLLFSLSISMR